MASTTVNPPITPTTQVSFHLTGQENGSGREGAWPSPAAVGKGRLKQRAAASTAAAQVWPRAKIRDLLSNKHPTMFSSRAAAASRRGSTGTCLVWRWRWSAERRAQRGSGAGSPCPLGPSPGTNIPSPGLAGWYSSRCLSYSCVL